MTALPAASGQHPAEQSRAPGYLAKRFKAFRRLQERRERSVATVTQIKRKACA